MKEDAATKFNRSAIIADIGTSITKAGLSIEEAPTSRFETLVGRSKYPKLFQPQTEGDLVVPLKEYRGLYKLQHPVKRGLLNPEADIKPIISKIYADLKVMNSKDVPVFFIEPPFAPFSQKFGLAMTLFDSFGVNELFFGTAGALSLHALGKLDGLLLECGDGVTQIVPMYNGYKLDHGLEKAHFAGYDVTQALKLSLRRRGTLINTSHQDLIFNEVKKAVCELDVPEKPRQPGAEISFPQTTKTFELPDGKIIEVGEDRFAATEILFDPESTGEGFLGIHQLVERSLSKLDLELRRHLLKSIYLAGGTSHTPGFAERLELELSPLFAQHTRIKVEASHPDRSSLAWVGGALISNLSTFSKMWITKKELEDSGDRILLQKCF